MPTSPPPKKVPTPNSNVLAPYLLTFLLYRNGRLLIFTQPAFVLEGAIHVNSALLACRKEPARTIAWLENGVEGGSTSGVNRGGTSLRRAMAIVQVAVMLVSNKFQVLPRDMHPDGDSDNDGDSENDGALTI